jgi:hypothetical protein
MVTFWHVGHAEAAEMEALEAAITDEHAVLGLAMATPHKDRVWVDGDAAATRQRLLRH